MTALTDNDMAYAGILAWLEIVRNRVFRYGIAILLGNMVKKWCAPRRQYDQRRRGKSQLNKKTRDDFLNGGIESVDPQM